MSNLTLATDVQTDSKGFFDYFLNSSLSSPQLSMFNHQYDVDLITSSYRVHKKLINNDWSTGVDDAAPLAMWVSYSGQLSPGSANSATSLPAAALRCYESIEQRLTELAVADDDDPHVEEAAARSALHVINQLKHHSLAPPAMSVHGGDAVVMLWALAGTTYALTVTDGELGYVVRQNKKMVRMADSIQLQQFRLEDLR